MSFRRCLSYLLRKCGQIFWSWHLLGRLFGFLISFCAAANWNGSKGQIMSNDDPGFPKKRLCACAMSAWSQISALSFARRSILLFSSDVSANCEFIDDRSKINNHQTIWSELTRGLIWVWEFSGNIQLHVTELRFAWVYLWYPDKEIHEFSLGVLNLVRSWGLWHFIATWVREKTTLIQYLPTTYVC